jgi:DNA (cytosine-5)-methyltransferase 1
MTHASLFSGIGGFDLAAEWAGFQNVFNCEWEEFPRKVLKHHFPNAEQYGDIKEFDATEYNGRVDVLSGGFPCQPFSLAGQRKGSEDERYLWKEMLRVIRECNPRWIVGENVRGIVNWSNGLVFEEVCADLEAIGYSVQSFIIPACATGAPHRRDRVWIVAHSDNIGTSSRLGEVQSKDGEIPKRNNDAQPSNPNTSVTSHTNSATSKSERINRPKEEQPIRQGSDEVRNRWEDFPTVPPICGGDDGLPKELDGITFPKWRSESIKGYGNAIVPQVAHRIFESIKEYELKK